MAWQLSSMMPSLSEYIWLRPCAFKLRPLAVLWLEHSHTQSQRWHWGCQHGAVMALNQEGQGASHMLRHLDHVV